MIYWARPKAVAPPGHGSAPGVTRRASLALAAEEHHAIRWCGIGDLDNLSPPMTDAVKWYCRQAIQEISDWQLPVTD